MRINRLKTAIALFLVLVLTETKAQVAVGYQVGTWYQFKTAAISYTLDDNCSNQIPVALPLFDQYNYKVTFNTVITWSPNWAGLLKASNNGHEIASHTMTHPTSLATLTLAQQDTELGQSQSTINTNIPNAKCVTVAYPNCNIGDLTTIKKYYIAGRICSGQIIPSSPSDFYNLSSIITGNTGSVQTAANLNSKVDAAKSSKGWCVFLTHGIDNDGGYSPTQSTEIKSHLTYVNTNNADFWVGTFGNVVKYIKERNASSLTETAITSDSLKLVIADNLDNTIYNVPISIRRTLPSGWQNPKIYMNGKVAAATVSVISGTSYIVFDAVPDQGNIYLVNTKTTTTTAPPSVTTPVTYCVGSTATTLTATGTALKWYTALTGGSALASAPVPATTTAGTTNYYVTQTLGGTESTPRTLITVTVNALPSAPAVTTPVAYCQNAAASVLGATGSALKWYTVSTGGTSSATTPVPSTGSVGTVNYYVSQTSNGCESPRAAIAVTVNTIPSSPSVTTPIAYCQNAAASVLTATGSALKWYTISTGGTGSATAPVPSTASAGTVSYYVSQTVNGCEGSRASLAVTVNALPSAPGVSGSVSYCQNAIATALTATGTSTQWYTVSTGGTGSATAPVPATASVGTVNYYVSQTSNGCESQRAAIAVTVNAIPSSPSVANPVAYCQNAAASVLTATGSALKWYTVSTGGTGSATTPVPSTASVGTVNYYVSQTVNGCESSRAAITVTVNDIPSAPTVNTPVTYCQNNSATPLTSSGTALKWYTAATGGTSSATSPTPVTTSAGSTNYYVSQTINGCESSRASIAVSVNATPSLPTVSSPVTYCQNMTAAPLSATGTGLQWYTAAAGGTGSSATPTPLTASAGSTNYYVSQTINGCESARSAITVTVNAIPSAPSVTTPLSYCQNAVASVLSAGGSSMKWYTAASGGTGTGNAPTPSTVSTGTNIYYVSQTLNGCESPRAAITVNITPAATATITAGGATAFCQGGSVTLTANTASSYIWFNGVQQVGNGNSFTAVSSGNYTVQVTDPSGCQGQVTSQATSITVNPLPSAAITAGGPTVFNQGGSVVLSANTGTSLTYQWYNGATPVGTGSTYTAAVEGNYTLEVTNAFSCKATSAPVNVVINPNQVPVISITAPADQAVFTAPANVSITAAASDPDGTVSKVDFYNGNVLLGTDPVAPYNFAMNNLAAGTYTITAIATDNNGAPGSSVSITITVNVPPNQLPVVNITAPANGTTYVESASISLEATASDADGSVTQVSFYNGNTLLGSDVSAPYSFAWNNVMAGTYQVTARATDNDGGSVTSSIVTITVTANQPSVITITSPADHSTVTGTAVTINVTASDPDGSITLVEFLDGTTVIGSSTTAPFTYTMDNPSSGIHDITVRVTDSHGGVTTSSTITFTVQTQTGLFSTGVYGQFKNAYPNPFHDAITVKAIGEIKHLSLMDMYGIRVKALNDIPVGQSLEIGQDLADGTYMLMVEYVNNSIEVIKIVKVK
jgi:hypothetical protein